MNQCNGKQCHSSVVAQIKLESTWLRYSKAAAFIIVCVFMFSLWNLFSMVSYADAMDKVFQQTAADYTSAGGDVSLALQTEAGVLERSKNVSEITNAVRYDYDNLQASQENFTLLGLANHLLGTASVLVIPAGFFRLEHSWLSTMCVQGRLRCGSVEPVAFLC